MTPDRSKAARELLAFYAEAGVDGAAIGEKCQDRLSGAGASSTATTTRARNRQRHGDLTARSADAGAADAGRHATRRATRATAAPTPPSWPRVRLRNATSLEEPAPSQAASALAWLKGSASRLVFADSAGFAV